MKQPGLPARHLDGDIAGELDRESTVEDGSERDDMAQVDQLLSQGGRIAVRPDWVSIIDFQTRFPSAIAKRMA